MKRENGSSDIVAVIFLFLIVLVGYGYINNLVQFVKCDFAEPYKAEVIRGIGIFVPFVGIITGYVDIEDGQNSK